MTEHGCPVCDDEFTSNGAARDHAWDAHGSCHHCGEEFDNQDSLYIHWLATHGDELSKTDRKRAKSEVGPLTFGDRFSHQGLRSSIAATNWKSLLLGSVIGLIAVLLVFQFVGGGLRIDVPGATNSVYEKQNAQKGLDVGNRAPNFTLETTDGGTVSLHGSDKPTVIFFMASWCSSCRFEEDNLRQVHERYGDSVRIISIDVDPKRDSMADLRQFQSKYGGDWIHAMGVRSLIQRYQIKALDTTYILNEHGVIVYKDRSITTPATFDEELSKLTAKQDGEMPSERFSDVGSVHWHANLTVSVEGDPVNFSKQKYMVRSNYVHFEGGDGTTIHKHAKGVTLAYFFETLDWKLTNECLTTDTGKSYCSGEGGELRIIVNGKEIDNLQYKIQDGDTIKVIYG